MAANYQIDAVYVNARTDWTHQVNPRPPQERREEQFVGIGQSFAFNGPALPPEVIVNGWLNSFLVIVTDNIVALDTQIAQYQGMQGDGLTHDVFISGSDFQPCVLIDFGTTGKYTFVYNQAIGTGVKVPVRFKWRQLTWQLTF